MVVAVRDGDVEVFVNVGLLITNCDGFLIDDSQCKCRVIALIIQIGENTQSAGAMKRHAYQNQGNYNPFHFGVKGNTDGADITYRPA